MSSLHERVRPKGLFALGFFILGFSFSRLVDILEDRYYSRAQEDEIGVSYPILPLHSVGCGVDVDQEEGHVFRGDE